MPNASDLANASLAIESVHNAIWRKDDLAKIFIPVFRNGATELWKFLQTICLGDQSITEGHRAVGIVACDEDDYVVKIVSRSGRPSQFVSHEASCLFTSS